MIKNINIYLFKFTPTPLELSQCLNSASYQNLAFSSHSVYTNSYLVSFSGYFITNSFDLVVQRYMLSNSFAGQASYVKPGKGGGGGWERERRERRSEPHTSHTFYSKFLPPTWGDPASCRGFIKDRVQGKLTACE